MGNTPSCVPYGTSAGSIKVINADGRVEEYTRPIRAAELMLENQGQFVCDSVYLIVGSRIPGLGADEELQSHHLYFLLPMDMLYSVLTEEELLSISCKVSNTTKKPKISTSLTSKNIKRIFPVLSDFCLFPAEEEPVTATGKDVTTRTVARVPRERSWRPALDTIEEFACMN